MPEPDFAGIEPTRVPEAKRRLAAIDKYLSFDVTPSFPPAGIRAGPRCCA